MQALGEFVKLRRRAAAVVAASPSAAAGSGGTMLQELPDYLLPFLLQARMRQARPSHRHMLAHVMPSGSRKGA